MSVSVSQVCESMSMSMSMSVSVSVWKLKVCACLSVLRAFGILVCEKECQDTEARKGGLYTNIPPSHMTRGQ